MISRNRGLERMLLGLFVVSGFAALIYQAIWSHYLGLSLGHAAYAQTLVLAIFMGGMAIGAWLVSRRGGQWKRLVFAYAIVEVVIGLAGLAFHPVFLAYTDFSQSSVYPALDGEGLIRAWQWGSAALLILPQSILLGMTFPLMSGGYLRVAPRADGEILGGLYFSNSIGAAFGALVATFVLLPWVGMPGTVSVAGALNLLVGLLALLLARRADLAAPAPAAAPAAGDRPPLAEPDDPEGGGFYRMMLLAAGITGASSFVYEIGWVRMLNQALGTTIHSFEIMLSAFILGLAFGGWWVRRRSQAIRDVVAYAGYAQIWMGLFALLSLPVFAQSFRWVGALMQAVPRDDTGYQLFTLGSAGIALVVMFPAAFFAGMTLPLFTMALLRRGAGEPSIGRVYAANTFGAILGVALAVHVLIPLLGLRLAVTVAALADIALGVVLLRRFADTLEPGRYLRMLAATAVVVALSLVVGRPDPRALASGVFRSGSALLSEDARIHYLRDGKTATVAVYSQGTAATIATNGKPDASLQLSPDGQVTDDEITMLMAGALPLAVHPAPERIAVIGWGSGLTTHTLLGSGVPVRVDSVEIERAMHDGARLFGERVRRAYLDPRSVIHFDDARTYFSAGRQQFDVIVSEPSNPWVSGVASLFTKEFYRFLNRHLADDGVLVQWVQSYELGDQLLATMLAAIAVEFPHVDVYLTNNADLILVASRSPLPALQAARLQPPQLAAELARVGVSGVGDLQVRRVGSHRVVDVLVALSGKGPHSDFYPEVSLEAPKDRFLGVSASRLPMLLSSGMPVLDLLDGRRPPTGEGAVSYADSGIAARLHWKALRLSRVLAGADVAGMPEEDPGLEQQFARLRALSAAPVPREALDQWLVLAAIAAEHTIAPLDAPELASAWVEPVWIDPAVQPEEVRLVLAAYRAAALRDAAAMHRDGEAALARLSIGYPQESREHMLVVAMLGAMGDGDPEAMLALDRGPGAGISAATDYGFVRAFILAWADIHGAGTGP